MENYTYGMEKKPNRSTLLKVVLEKLDERTKTYSLGGTRAACNDKGFSVNVQNSIVVVERGECSFVDKARLIQKKWVE